jgi:hypothetical protein
VLCEQAPLGRRRRRRMKMMKKERVKMMKMVARAASTAAAVGDAENEHEVAVSYCCYFCLPK